jgi:predicted fused transcriptional regulator/phosphomethylpyrimidine kinase
MLSDERSAIQENLLSVASRLHNNIPQNLVPPDGVQLAYARKGARDEGGIACVRGGLCVENKKFDLLSVGFGDGGTIATVLLTAMKFDPLHQERSDYCMHVRSDKNDGREISGDLLL